MVRLEINASNDEPDYSRVDSGATSEPAISRRSAQTNVLLYDGETTVIGGLSKTYGSDAESGIPWLRSIPLLGVLFRNNAREERQEDMLIFITPYVLDEKPPPSGQSKPGVPVGSTPLEPTDVDAGKPGQSMDPTQTRTAP